MLGELRILRVSYVVLLGIPIVAFAASRYNIAVDDAWERFGRQLEPARNALVAQVHSMGGLTSGQRDRIHAWLHRARTPQSAQDVKLLVEWAGRLVHQFDGSAVSALLEDWIDKADEFPNLALKYHIKLGCRFKVMFFAALFISVGNIIYSLACPPTLRIVHRPDRQGRATGLGDEFDWSLSLYDELVKHDFYIDPAERTRLIESLVKSRWPARRSNAPQQTKTNTWVLSARRDLLEHNAPARRACQIFYFAGLIFTAWLVLSATAVVVWSKALQELPC